MSDPAFSEGLRPLRTAGVALAFAIVAGAAFAWASAGLLEKARRQSAAAHGRLAEATALLDAARRDKEGLQSFLAAYRELAAQGFLLAEDRLDWLERLDRLKSAHRLEGLEVDIAPQRPLSVAAVASPAAIAVRASRVKIAFRALHEGDALAFLGELSRPRQGFLATTRCHLARLEPAAADAREPRVAAQCTFEWITLRESRRGHAG